MSPVINPIAHIPFLGYSIRTTSRKDLDDVLSQIQDGRGSFLGRVQRMTKLGGLNPIKPIPDEAMKNIENAEVNKIPKTKIKE